MPRKKMRYSLVNYVGSGSATDPIRPAGVDLFANASAIDLRPDSTAVAGWGFLATPIPPTASALIFSLGDDLTDLSLANRLLLQSKLGITLEAGRTLRRHIRDILTEHARTDGTRWKPLLPEWINGSRARAWRVRLGGEVIDELPVVEGGSTISESFDKANADTLGPDLTWTEVAGDWDIVSNKAQLQAGSVLRCGARADSALATADHWAQVDCDPAGASADIGDHGVAVRFAAAANTYYELGRNPSTDTRRIVKFVAGVGTLVASAAYTDDDGNHTVYGEVNGSSLRLLIDGANELTATDTAITANTRVGLSGIRNAAPNAVTVDYDNFTAGDLGTGQPLYQRRVLALGNRSGYGRGGQFH